MKLVLEANSLVHTMYHISKRKWNDELGEYEPAIPDPPDVVERFLNRLVYIADYAEQLAAKVGEPLTLMAVFDPVGRKFRHDIFPDYKANRTTDLLVVECVAHAREAVEHADDWQCLVAPMKFEADDLIASLAHKADERVLIHSSDKDFNQCLVDKRVGIIKKSGVEEVINHNFLGCGAFAVQALMVKDMTYRSFVREYGFTPDRWVDYQCLTGDSSDNVKGAYGIGDKMARKILTEWPGDLMDLDPEQFPLNKKQRAGWQEFADRYERLVDVFTLRTNLGDGDE